ncbi:hypothetical protein LTR35_012377 [Friedmanniomyces endolithicus]|nr:hypothetical protein LTR35_012377 [Friedmanniomyces endolithicus]KAK1015258.1 hypothetical protein LTR54_003801 [Friedmanniomyces endolithicus]
MAAQPCADAADPNNHTPGHVGSFIRQPCSKAHWVDNVPPHAPVFPVCLACQWDTIFSEIWLYQGDVTMSLESPAGPPNPLPNFAMGQNYPGNPLLYNGPALVPAVLPPCNGATLLPAGTAVGHLTRLCSPCEKHQQELCLTRQSPNCPQQLVLPWASRGLSVPGFTHACVCRRLLIGLFNDENMCNSHRYDLIERVTDRRDRNDQWLQSLDAVPARGGWLACTASAAVQNRRFHSGTLRACLCGSDVDVGPTRTFEVLACMSCGGMNHVVAPANSRHTLSLARTLDRPGRPIALGRPRSRKTAAYATNVLD